MFNFLSKLYNRKRLHRPLKTMEAIASKQINNKITKTKMDKLKSVGYGIMIFIVSLCFISPILDVFAENVPEPMYPQALDQYNASVYNLCLSEKGLANAYWHDYTENFLDFEPSDEDIIRWKNKRGQDCPLS